jgi:hypothetical protein
MTLGMMPMTGVPLPFVSYGGSSMFATMIGFGLASERPRSSPRVNHPDSTLISRFGAACAILTPTVQRGSRTNSRIKPAADLKRFA